MAGPLLLALDQGTTSTRAILFDAGGAALAEAGRPLQQFYPADGWVERRFLRYRPALEHAVRFQPEIIVQPGGVVFLDDEALLVLGLNVPLRLRSFAKFSLFLVGL